MVRLLNHNSKRLLLYFAAPLFSEAERSFNKDVTQELEQWVDVYLPQRDGGLMSELLNYGVPPKIAARRVFNLDMDAIQRSDYIIAILDGRAIDEGVAFELGIAFAQSKRCIGLQTDCRRLAAWGNNPMISGALEIIFASVNELISWITSEVIESSHIITKKILSTEK